MQFCEFCEKEVISVRDCRKLGNVYDMEFDACSGCICKLIVREHSGLLGFLCCGAATTVPYSKIKQIGSDIILVDL